MGMFVAFTTVILATLLITPTSSLAACPKKCKCYTKDFNEVTRQVDKVWAVGCRLLTAIPSDIPDTTQRLYLSRNPIKTIPANAFSNLVNLRTLYWDRNWLTELPAGAFDSLTELRKLSMEGSQLTRLPDRIFHPLTKMQYLTLEDMKLEEVQGDLLETLTDLRAVSLGGNKLSGLPAEIFKTNSKLTEVRLYGGKFICCEVKDAIASLKPGVKVKGSCQTPEGGKERFSQLSSLKLNCKNDESSWW